MATDQNSSGSHTHTFVVEPGSGTGTPPSVPDRWRLIRRVGGGGQGQVWLAEDRELGQLVALKIVPTMGRDGVVERTRREARMGRFLDHPHLVRVHDLVIEQGSCVVVMEWLDGPSLHAEMASGPLAVTRVETVAEAVLEALAYLHRQGVVHRDVKASNVLVGRSGQIKLGDLGLVRGPGDADLTRTGLAVGTPAYMSPEQLRGERPGPPADLYALGVTLFELLTGDKPFGDGSDAAVVYAHLRWRRPVIRRRRPDCPRWLASFVQRLIERSPRDRFPDAAAALETFRRRRRVASRRLRRTATGLTSALVAASVVAAWLVRGGAPEPAGVTLLGDDVVASDSDGRELWRFRPPGTPGPPLLADVLGDRRTEVVFTWSKETPPPTRKRTFIEVLDAAGVEQARLEAGTRLGEPQFPGVLRSASVDTILATDLDGDGRDDLAWVAKSPDWYPSVVEQWLGRTEGVVHDRLLNSGHVGQLEAADVDGDGRRELVACGLNNPLGFQLFVAVLEVDPAAVTSPDRLFLPGNTDPASAGLRSYALLGPDLSHSRVAAAGPAGIELEGEEGPRRLTPFGVPVGSPAAAVSPERQVAFWRDLVLVARALERQPVFPDDRISEVEARYPLLLAEPGFRLAADLLLAHTLAEGGGHREAVALLRAAVARDPGPGDRWLRLGEQLLMLGDRSAGRQAVRRSVDPSPRGRTVYDALMILGLDAALNVDDDGLEEALRLPAGPPPTSVDLDQALLSALVFSRGLWGDPALANGSATGVYPWTAVLAEWARLERGAPASEVASAAARLAEIPEISEPAHLLEARARRSAGDLATARALARDSLTTLRRRARTSYEHYFWVPLAEWVYGDSLMEAGDSDGARAHLEAAARLAPRTFFGRDARRRLAGG